MQSNIDFLQHPNCQDWDKNIYFNCSSEAVGSREACGVPFRFSIHVQTLNYCLFVQLL